MPIFRSQKYFSLSFQFSTCAQIQLVKCCTTSSVLHSPRFRFLQACDLFPADIINTPTPSSSKLLLNPFDLYAIPAQFYITLRYLMSSCPDVLLISSGCFRCLSCYLPLDLTFFVFPLRDAQKQFWILWNEAPHFFKVSLCNRFALIDLLKA